MAEGRDIDFTHHLAGELYAARTLIENLALALCLDPLVFERHAETLQQFDHLGQVIGEVARALQSRAPAHEAIAAIQLEAMRDRLNDAHQDVGWQ